MALLPNSTITITRLQTQIATGVRCQIDWPHVRHPERMPSGTAVRGILRAAAGTNLQQEDSITITAQDGHASVQQVSQFVVLGPVIQYAGPLAYMQATIEGMYT